MKKIKLLIALLGIIGIASYGCAKKTSAGDKVLAEVSNKTITVKEFKAKIAKMPLYYQNVVEKNKKRYLDEMIMEMLLYEEAVRGGLEKDKEVQEVLEEAKKKIIIAKYLKNEVEDKVKVTDEEMSQFYEANKDQFKSPPLWRASHILVANETEAKDIASQLAKGANFEELAKAHSIDATSTRGGDVGYFKAGQLIPDFEKACLQMKVGETSDIVHTQFGYHIIKLTDKKEPEVEPYEKAKRAIEGELKRKKRSDLFENVVQDLKKKYNVKISEDVFESVDEADKGKQESV